MATAFPLYALKQPQPTAFFLHQIHHSRFNPTSLSLHTRQSHIPRLPAFSRGRTPSNETGCPVPFDQQPINEYQSLSISFPFSWASAEPVEYGSRLFATGLAFALLVGLPVSWVGSVGSGGHDPVRLALGSVSGGILVVTLAVLRMYLGWAYVGNRLLSATVEYEETGWYDGQIWVKTAEVLARDRLLGSFQVKPVLTRLKNTLVILAASLLFLVPYLFTYESSEGSVQRLLSEERVIAGVYSEDSARSFEPDAFCGDPGSSPSVDGH